MNKIILFVIILFFSLDYISGEVITKLQTDQKIVALTFDACETKTPSYFDKKILDFLVANKIPFTIFVSGKFAKRNKEDLIKLSKIDFIEIENHSLNHFQNMENLDAETIKKEVLENEKIITDITGKKPVFFRFPGGNYDKKSLALVESLGYIVTHWDFASGDPDKNITPEKEINWVVLKTRPSSILIFHINGRGYSTGAALPVIVKKLKEKGYSFTKLEDNLYLPKKN